MAIQLFPHAVRARTSKIRKVQYWHSLTDFRSEICPVVSTPLNKQYGKICFRCSAQISTQEARYKRGVQSSCYALRHQLSDIVEQEEQKQLVLILYHNDKLIINILANI